MDAFAKKNAWYGRSYACAAWTLPSTASILTGLYPVQHGVVKAGNDFGRLDPAFETVAETWKARGRRTAAFINNAFLAPEFKLNAGFDVYDYHGAHSVGHRSADTTVDLAIAWLKSGETPAFLMVHIMEPHFDYAPPAPFAGAFTQGMAPSFGTPVGDARGLDWMFRRIPPPTGIDLEFLRKLYLEEVLTADAAIGRLLRALSDEAIVVITADHGEELFEYGGFEHGHTTLDVVSHVPLLVRAPAVAAGRHDEVVDCTTTWAALVQSSLPEGGFAITEDTLYGAEEVSITGPTERLTAYPESRTLGSWTVAPDGREIEGLSPPTPQLRARLTSVRGGLESAQARGPVPIAGPDEFEKLRALGYVE